jgi:phosphoenolpyruvate-protein kinase (PTS system EI component)
MTRIGQGLLTSGRECQGTLRVVDTIPDVLRLMREDLSDVILFMQSASATAATPLFAKIKGIVCTAGGATSHLAIVAREFDLPCVMASAMEYTNGLDGRRVSLNQKGEIFLDN